MRGDDKLMETKIYDLDKYDTNSRNGFYGGKAGSKEGISIDGENWIVKYPKNTKGMRGKVAPYTTAPLSEYIGSHIYQMLGIDCHETILGIRNEKLVVACKDFCKEPGTLREIRTIKNVYNKELSEKLDETLFSTSSSHIVSLEDIMTHLEHNPILKNIPDIKKRFWEQVVVDVYINNNDRNNGNWGILYENDKNRLAPVFDNGAAFSNKLPDEVLLSYLQSDEKMQKSIDSSRTIYSIDEHELLAKDIVSLNNNDLNNVIIKLYPLIKSKRDKISDFIRKIPEKYNGVPVCSDIRKEFYIKTMNMREEQYFRPMYDKAMNSKKTILFGTTQNMPDYPQDENIDEIKYND